MSHGELSISNIRDEITKAMERLHELEDLESSALSEMSEDVRVDNDNPNMVDGKYSIHNLLDLKRLSNLLEQFSKASKYSVSVVAEPPGKLLFKTGWQNICTKFHRVNPDSVKECLQSERELADQLKSTNALSIMECRNGLVDCTVPITVKGVHIATLVIGQILLHEPDIEKFKQQAEKYNYDSVEYLDALSKVPVVNEEQFKTLASFLREVAVLVSEIGLRNLELRERTLDFRKEIEERSKMETRLRESEEQYRSLFETALVGLFRTRINDGLILKCNDAAARIMDFESADDLVTAGIKISEYYPKEKRDVLIQTLETYGEISDFEAHWVYPNGREQDVRVSARLYPEEGYIEGVVIDITERKKAEEEHRKVSERLAMTVEVASDGTWDWDLKSNKTYFDPRYYTMVGYEPDEFPSTYEEWEKRVHPEDIEQAIEAIQITREGRAKAYHVEFRFRAKTGDWVWILGKGKVVEWDKNGKATRLIGTHTDISERKKAEEALRASENMFRAITENTSDGTIILNGDLIYTYVSPSTFGMLGLTQEDVIGKQPVDFIHPDDMDTLSGTFDKCRSEPGRTFINPDFRVRHKDGRWFPLEGLFTGMLDVPGVNGIVCNFRDISERKSIQKEEFKRLETIQRQQATVVGLASNKSMVAGDFNNFARSLTTMVSSALDVESVGVWLLNDTGTELHPVDRYIRSTTEHVEGGPILLEKAPRYYNALKTGRVSPVSDVENDPRLTYFVDEYFRPNKITAILDAPIRVSGNFVGLICFEASGGPRHWQPHEMTFAAEVADQAAQSLHNAEKNKAAEEIRKKNEELTAALKVQSEFLSMVSHELRTPLVPIIGYSDLLLEGSFGEMPENAIEALTSIRGRAEDLSALIEDLLDLSRMEHKNISLQLEPLEIPGQIAGMIKDYQSMNHCKQVNIRLTGQAFRVNADHMRLQQIVRNLINNAIKYSYDTVDILINTNINGQYGVMTFTDNGIGIAPENLSRIFERFYQVADLDTREHGGSGLGLAITRELVEMMKGSITAESKPGNGSKFTVKLPLT